MFVYDLHRNTPKRDYRATLLLQEGVGSLTEVRRMMIVVLLFAGWSDAYTPVATVSLWVRLLHELPATTQVCAVVISPFVFTAGAMFAKNDILSAAHIEAGIVARAGAAFYELVWFWQDDVALAA